MTFILFRSSFSRTFEDYQICDPMDDKNLEEIRLVERGLFVFWVGENNPNLVTLVSNL